MNNRAKKASDSITKNTVSDATGAVPAIKPPKWERFVVPLILLALIGLDLATYIDYPQVWRDEVWFSEPAVNWVLHGSFTTTTYELQPPGTFPTINCPLYIMALAPWLAIAGTKVIAIRSFNYVLMALAAWLAWLVAWRFDLIKRPGHRVAFILLLQLGYGMTFASRCSRPDILGLVCLLLLLLSFQIRRAVLRHVAIAFFSAVTVWIGLQVSLFAWFASAVAWFLFRRPFLWEAILSWASMAVSSALLLLFLYSKGVLSSFLLVAVGMLGKRYIHETKLSALQKIAKVSHGVAFSYVEDFSALVLTLALLLWLLLSWKKLDHQTRRILSYCLVLVFATPALFEVVGHYALYYAYVRFVPAALAFFVAWNAVLRSNAWPFCLSNLIGAGGLTLAVAVGLPMRLTMAAMTAHIMPRAKVQKVISSQIHADDVAFSDYAFFFEVKNVAGTVYDRFCSPLLHMIPLPGRDLTQPQKDSVNVLVIRPEEKEFIFGYFGGNWTVEGGPFGDSCDPGPLARVPMVGKRFIHHLNQPQDERYQVQIYRRVSKS